MIEQNTIIAKRLLFTRRVFVFPFETIEKIEKNVRGS